MHNLFFTDNNQAKDSLWSGSNIPNDSKDYVLESINEIANISLKELSKKNPNLLVFPTSFNIHNDDIDEKPIFNLYSDNRIKTSNILGFIGKNEVKLTIGSRFDEGIEKQYFMQYMLQKVFAINLVDLNTRADKENIWDFLLMYMFPYYLNKALSQGLYKEYKKVKHNNANVKGAIDIARHIKGNIPFAGKVAYNTREFSFDNPITQLIRHTIEFITNKGHSSALKNNSDTIDFVKQIRSTTPTYNIRKRQSIIQQNYKNVNHPFFSEYEDLRIICQKILHQDGLSMQNSQEEIHGLLFDGAWLWEEYLNTILNPFGYLHPENNKGIGGYYLFEKSKKMYPDFYYPKKNIVIDAKYKFLNKDGKINREDLYQVTSYMYRLKATKGMLLYPSKNILKKEEFKMHKESYGGEGESKFIKLGMKIPQKENGFQCFFDFVNEIQGQEKLLKKELQESTPSSPAPDTPH